VPELPEVESLVRDLSPTLVGRTIVSVEVHKPKLFNAVPASLWRISTPSGSSASGGAAS